MTAWRTLRGTRATSLSMHAAFLVALVACTEPAAPTRPTLSLSAVSEVGDNGVSQLVFTMRNESPNVVSLRGCPRAPGYFLDGNLGAWFEVASVGVVCQPNQVVERVSLTAGQTVSRSFGVASPGTYRFRLLVDDPQGGTPLTLTSNALIVR